MATQTVHHPTRRSQAGHFALHYVGMCIPMCVGFTVLDAAYLWLAGLAGHDDPFRELPVLSVVVVGFNMTAPMVWFMLWRGMPSRAVAEMAAAMGLWAVILLLLGEAGVLPEQNLALLEHGLMMPVMLVPMLLGSTSTPAERRIVHSADCRPAATAGGCAPRRPSPAAAP